RKRVITAGDVAYLLCPPFDVDRFRGVRDRRLRLLGDAPTHVRLADVGEFDRLALLVRDGAEFVRRVRRAHHDLRRTLTDDLGDGTGLQHRALVLPPVVLAEQPRLVRVGVRPSHLEREVRVIAAVQCGDGAQAVTLALDPYAQRVPGLAHERRLEVRGQAGLALDDVDVGQADHRVDAEHRRGLQHVEDRAGVGSGREHAALWVRRR